MKSLQSLFTPAQDEPAFSYFAGGNTAEGFRMTPDPLFPCNCDTALKRIYVIKGSSGSGKSTLMRRIADTGETMGYAVTRYLCGSDPGSLDGVRIDGPSGAVGLCDGTAPHAFDPTFPGLNGQWIVLTEPDDALRDCLGDAMATMAKKKAAYARAAVYLSAFRDADRLSAETVSDAFLSGKAERYFEKHLPDGSGASAVRRVLTHGITMKGAAALPTLSAGAAEVYSLAEAGEAARVWLGLLADVAARKRLSPVVALSPCDRRTVLAVHLPAQQITYTTLETGEPLRVERFLDARRLREARPILRQAMLRRETALLDTLSALGDAAEAHFAMEKLFRPALNEDAVRQAQATVTEALPGLIS